MVQASAEDAKSVMGVMQSIMWCAICVIPSKVFTCVSFFAEIFMPRKWQYNRNTEWIAKTSVCVCVCVCMCDSYV